MKLNIFFIAVETISIVTRQGCKGVLLGHLCQPCIWERISIQNRGEIKKVKHQITKTSNQYVGNFTQQEFF